MRVAHPCDSAHRLFTPLPRLPGASMTSYCLLRIAAAVHRAHLARRPITHHMAACHCPGHISACCCGSSDTLFMHERMNHSPRTARPQPHGICLLDLSN